MLTRIKAFATAVAAGAKLVVRELVSSAPSQAIILGFITLFSYLTSEAARLATGHYFHWFGVALVAFFGSALLKVVLPEVAKGWHTGRISAEREAARLQAIQELSSLLDSWAKSSAKDGVPANGAYL
jgi:pheromone shutdown protein TraB